LRDHKIPLDYVVDVVFKSIITKYSVGLKFILEFYIVDKYKKQHRHNI